MNAIDIILHGHSHCHHHYQHDQYHFICPCHHYLQPIITVLATAATNRGIIIPNDRDHAHHDHLSIMTCAIAIMTCV